MTLLHMTVVYGYMLYYVLYMNLIIILMWLLWLSSFGFTTDLSRFQIVLDYYDYFTLISIIRLKAIIKKNMHFNVNYKMVEQRLCS